MIRKVKGFGIVDKAEVDVFLELSCFSDDPTDVGNLISDSCAFSKSSLNMWKFSVHILLKPSLENFEPYFTRVWDECNCVVVLIGGSDGKEFAYNAETQVQSLGQEDLLEKEMATHSSILVWKNPMDGGAW